MPDILTHHPDYLPLSTLQVEDELLVTTGTDSDAWQYDFIVTNATSGRWPQGLLTAINPFGYVSGTVPFAIHGCGIWTTPKQNPVQKQMGLAFTPNYDGLSTGSFLWGQLEGQVDRIAFTEPGQEISDIAHVPYRENSLLTILGIHGDPMRIADIVAATEGSPKPLAEREVRETLKVLTAAGHVALLKSKVQLFQITGVQPD